MVIPAVFAGFLAPVPPKLIGGLGLSFESVGAGAVPGDFPVDGGAEALAVCCSRFCKSFEVEVEAVVGVGVPGTDRLLFGAFS